MNNKYVKIIRSSDSLMQNIKRLKATTDNEVYDLVETLTNILL